MKCYICKDFGCTKCYIDFRADTVKDGVLELIDKGPPMGIGVFVAPGKSKNNALYKGQKLGEYIGELLPGTTPQDSLSQYAFTWDETKPDTTNCIEASTHGNWARFMNHHCRANVESRAAVISGRQIVTLMALRKISEGEELCINYGRDYFQSHGILCWCDYAGAGKPPHLPPK